MSEYFSNFNTMFYNMDKSKPIRSTRCVNITNRVDFSNKILRNVLAYYPYKIKENETAESISYDYYGSVIYTWLIYLVNGINDPLFEWPKFGKAFRNDIISKYTSIDNAQNTIHHYEQILRDEIPATADTPKILEKTVVIDKTTFDSLTSSEKKSISNFDFEVIEREKKRNIFLIEDVYADQVLSEFRKVYGG